MLELRPVCENCCKTLQPNSLEAMICSFECTFCSKCADEILKNVCPNCGGGFTPRPIRPTKALAKYPATTKVIHTPIDPRNHEQFSKDLRMINPADRAASRNQREATWRFLHAPHQIDILTRNNIFVFLKGS